MGIEAAIIGSAIVGAGASAVSANKQSKAAESAADKAAAANDAALQFQIEQYNDWKNIFGDVQETLSGYYNTLSPSTYAAMNIQNIETEYNQANQQMLQQLSQRGLANSGAAAQGIVDLQNSRALAEAQARTNATDVVKNQQTQFLGLGMGQDVQLANNISSLYGNQANMYNQQSNMYANNAAQSYAGIGQSIGQGISSYYQYNALQNNGGSSWLTNNPSVASGAIKY
jgi:hypothetical protein